MKAYKRNAVMVLAGSMLLSGGIVIGGLINDKSMATTESSLSGIHDPAPDAGIANGEHPGNQSELGEWGDEDYRNAVEIKNSFPEHFRCNDFPEGDAFTFADMIPTGNVVVTIKYDKKTKSYRVIQADPRIIVQHYIGTNPAFGNENIEDVFAFHPKDGVEIYGWYAEYRSSGGEDATDWMNGEVGFGNGGDSTHRIVAGRYANNNVVRYVLVATDTRTCKPGSVKVPNGMWDKLSMNAENTPSFG